MPEELSVQVPQRDGLTLTTDVFLPEGRGPWPVLLHRTPYGSMWFADQARQMTGEFAAVVQNCRGRFGSDGLFDLGARDADDGYDSVEWISRQPWCDGRVSGYGYSYGGYTQLRTASAKPPSLISVAPLLAGAWWNGLFFRDPGGPVNLAIAAHWLPRQASADATCKEECRDLVLSRAFEFDQILEDGRVSLRAALAHPALGRLPLIDPWAFEGCEHFADIWRGIFQAAPPASWFQDEGPPAEELFETPALIFNGWYDMGSQGSIETFRRLSRGSSSPHRLIMAPLGHGEELREIELPQVRWRFGFDVDHRWTKEWMFDPGELRGLSPVTYFLLRANEWRSASSFPPSGVTEERLFLSPSPAGESSLSEIPEREDTVRGYRYDPRLPVPTRGGMGMGLPAGPCDQTGVTGGSRQDVLSFTGPRLTRDIEITGAVEVVLYASSDSPDTDFTAKLIEIPADGPPISVCDGIVRARYRNSIHPEFLSPGSVEKFRIHLGSIAYLVRKGHRLRLDISSSNFPRFDRNANTGAPEGTDRAEDLRVASNVIHASPTRPSHLVLPVMT